MRMSLGWISSPNQIYLTISSQARATGSFSGSSGMGQLLPGLEQQLRARMEELRVGKQGSLHLRPIEGVFRVLPVIYAKRLPSMVELGWILEAGDHVPTRQMDAILEAGDHLPRPLDEAGDCMPRQPWIRYTLQRQRDPTKGNRLWLVLDGVVRAWANCKDGQRYLPSGSSQASCGTPSSGHTFSLFWGAI